MHIRLQHMDEKGEGMSETKIVGIKKAVDRWCE